MSNVLELASDLAKQAGKPAYIEFSTVAKHLQKQSEEQGRYVAVDVDMVTVRQIGGTDSCLFRVDSWLNQNRLDVKGGRLPAEHDDYYKRAYQRWKSGQEIPVEGTPIKGWPVISPAQTSLLVSIGIRTVEDLASINDEVKARVGMGAGMLKNKAMAWLAQAQDKGPLTMQMAAIQQENDTLKLNLAALSEQVEALRSERKMATPKAKKKEIEIDDIMGDDEKPAKSGRRKEE
jgi:DNA-binding helix-hairpin-helix protein with protein kinase domain